MKNHGKGLLLLAWFGAQAALCQPFSFGVKAGAPLNDALKTPAPGYFSDSKRYVIGPMAEVHLPFRVSVEFDALYRPIKYGFTPAGDSTSPSFERTGSRWEFPLLLKYRLTGGLLRPYLGAGIAFNKINLDLADHSGAGAVLEGGIELRLPFLRIAPEIRYTRWGTTSFATAAQSLAADRNQAELLVGISF